jgi:hypothetical protein
VYCCFELACDVTDFEAYSPSRFSGNPFPKPIYVASVVHHRESILVVGGMTGLMSDDLSMDSVPRVRVGIFMIQYWRMKNDGSAPSALMVEMFNHTFKLYKQTEYLNYINKN